MTPTIAILYRLIEKESGLPRDRLSLESRFDEIGIDSLSFMELLLILEKELNISFPVATPAVRTIGDIAALVDGLRAETQGHSPSVAISADHPDFIH